jgi:PAT family beta-lactamase induction signal transducer AmpG
VNLDTYFYNKKFAVIFALGFCSGIPFLLTLSTLSFWLSENGISKTVIGLFMFANIPYSIKFLWAPVLDRFSIKILSKKLGRRRSWMFLSQFLLIISVYLMGKFSPTNNILAMAIVAFFITFFAATQDILIDVIRLEWIPKEKSPMAIAYETVGFRLGMIVSGAGALYIANEYGWGAAYTLMSVILFIGPLVTIFIKEPKNDDNLIKKPITIKCWLNPINDIMKKKYWIYILVVIFSFKCTDVVLNSMCAPFLCEIGFSKIEFANITKVYGIGLMMIGSFLGGIFMTNFGSKFTISLSFILQIISSILFVNQAYLGHDIHFLTVSIGFESFSSGLAATCFISFLSQLCRENNDTATNFTFLYSIGSLSRVLVSSIAGVTADYSDWNTVFLISIVPSAIGLFSYLFFVSKSTKKSEKQTSIEAV